MSKRFLSAFLALIVILSLTACSQSTSGNSESGKKIIVIDYFQAINIYYNGVSGSGNMTLFKDIEYIDYDKANSDIQAFLKNISVKANKETDLSNGESVTVSLSYSYETAEKLGIFLKTTAQKYTVHGLYGDNAVTKTSSVDYSDIHQDLLSELDEDETVVSAYYMYNENNDAATDADHRVVSEVIFIVTNGTNYYRYSVGVGGDGKALGGFLNNYGKAIYKNWAAEDDVYSDLCSSYGADSLEKIS